MNRAQEMKSSRFGAGSMHSGCEARSSSLLHLRSRFYIRHLGTYNLMGVRPFGRQPTSRE